MYAVKTAPKSLKSLRQKEKFPLYKEFEKCGTLSRLNRAILRKTNIWYNYVKYKRVNCALATVYNLCVYLSNYFYFSNLVSICIIGLLKRNNLRMGNQSCIIQYQYTRLTLTRHLHGKLTLTRHLHGKLIRFVHSALVTMIVC